jgi:SAM-dependent methyltransferase
MVGPVVLGFGSLHIPGMPEPKPGGLESTTPSAVGLTRLSARLSFPPEGEALYRSTLRSVGLAPESEFLLVPSGRGRSARFIAEFTGASGAGADPDAGMVTIATERAKAKGLGARLHFDQAFLHDLPYQDNVFDLAFAEIELAAARNPPAALRELVRVTRPGGTIVLVQLVWLQAMDPPRREALIERLGVQPLMVMEWKQILRDAGVSDVQVEDWSGGGGWPRRMPVVGGLAQLFTVRGKLRLLPRAWDRWRWRGVRAVLSRERELRQLLEAERVLGVAVIRGTVGPDETGDDNDQEEREERDE